jgi:hypothetical protein
MPSTSHPAWNDDSNYKRTDTNASVASGSRPFRRVTYVLREMPEVDVLPQKRVAVANRLFVGKCQASVGILHDMAYSVYPTSELCASTQFTGMF